MRKIHVAAIQDAVKKLAMEACTVLSDDVVQALETAVEQEKSKSGKDVLWLLIENVRVACRENMPLCQDTGMAVVFCEMGQSVQVTGGSLSEAINEGIRRGYAEGSFERVSAIL